MNSSVVSNSVMVNPWVPQDLILTKKYSSMAQERRKGHRNACVESYDNGDSVDSTMSSSTSFVALEGFKDCTEGKKRRDNSVLKNEDETCGKPENVLPPVGLDCEMVGVGDDKCSALARCSVVGYNGEVIYDVYVKPDKPITDYRTKWSGIRPKHMENAISFRSARRKVKRIIKNRVLVGHALQFDLKVLKLTHHVDLIRDTSKHIPLRVLAGFPRNSTPSLKRLTRKLLKWEIQINEHSSVEDARAAMALYRLCDKQCSKEVKGKIDRSYLEDDYWPKWTEVLSSKK